MRTYIKFFLFSFSLILPTLSVSQDAYQDYQPVKFSRIPKELIDQYAFKFGQWGQKNTLVGLKAKTEFAKFAGEKAKFIAALDSAKLLMFDDSITAYLNGIKDEILSANDAFKDHECKIFTFRSLEPNAFSLGEGIILFNLGLLEVLETKEQFASIIAHEMSHDILNHVFLSNERFYRELYDTQFRKTLRRAARTSMGRNTAVKRLTDGFLEQHFGYRRSEEIMADSLGFILFNNAGFKGIEFIHALEKLDQVDEILLDDTLQLENIFQFSNYSFNPDWLNPENAKSGERVDSSLTIEQDTFKSHPDCDIRIEKIKKLSVELAVNLNDEGQGIEVPENIINAVSFESLGAVMLAQDYAVALFISLNMLQDFPDNVYLKTVIAHCLAELYLAFKNNEYLDYVQFQDPAFPDGYNKLLVFLQNMTSTSLKEIFDAYMTAELLGVENSYIAFLQLLRFSHEKLDYDDIHDYEQAYKDPYFTKLLKDKWTASQ